MVKICLYFWLFDTEWPKYELDIWPLFLIDCTSGTKISNIKNSPLSECIPVQCHWYVTDRLRQYHRVRSLIFPLYSSTGVFNLYLWAVHATDHGKWVTLPIQLVMKQDVLFTIWTCCRWILWNCKHYYSLAGDVPLSYWLFVIRTILINKTKKNRYPSVSIVFFPYVWWSEIHYYVGLMMLWKIFTVVVLRLLGLALNSEKWEYKVSFYDKINKFIILQF